MKQQQKIILGPPGCGKTTYLLEQVDQEMQNGTLPNRIGYFSFTRKATHEAMDRACAKFNFKRQDLPYFRTLHSLGFQELGLNKNQIMGAAHYKQIGTALGLVFSDYMNFEEGMPVSAKSGDQVLYIVGMHRARMVSIEEQYKASTDLDIDWFQLKQFNDTLVAYKRDSGMLDFSDILDSFRANCAPLDIDIAVIDEAQDLSRQQWAMIMHAVANAKRVYIAGDDDQAIYRWSGADVEAFLGLQGERIVLDQSYRLPQAVHQFCNKISSRIRKRFPKQWKPRKEKGAVHYLNALEHIEIQDGSYLFLARNKYLLERMEQFVRASGIPYTVNNRSSVDHNKVRAIVTWERLRRGDDMPLAQVREMYQFIRSGEGIKRGHKKLPGPDDQMINMQWCIEHAGLTTDKIWHEALTAIPAEEMEFYVAAKRRGEKLAQQPRVHLSSIHGVKGGEADHVVLLPDMAYRSFAEYQRDPDDEHRVAYVGASRAKQTLTILSPSSTRAYVYP
jgi:DNA helicase-2/ATP-dependent DNA helicase PcrA